MLVNFGRQLTKLRGSQSRGAVCRALRKFGLTVERSTLLHYERGRVAAPDPAIVWALARYYGLDSVDELLQVLVMDRTGRKLRDGVDLTVPALSSTQRTMAELMGQLSPTLQEALVVLAAYLAGTPDTGKTDNPGHTLTGQMRVVARTLRATISNKHSLVLCASLAPTLLNII